MTIVLVGLRDAFCRYPCTPRDLPDGVPFWWFDLGERIHMDYHELLERFGQPTLSREFLIEQGLLPIEPTVDQLDIEREFLTLHPAPELEEILRICKDDEDYDLQFRVYMEDHFPCEWTDFVHGRLIPVVRAWAERNRIERFIEVIPRPGEEIMRDARKRSQYYYEQSQQLAEDEEKHLVNPQYLRGVRLVAKLLREGAENSRIDPRE